MLFYPSQETFHVYLLDIFQVLLAAFAITFSLPPWQQPFHTRHSQVIFVAVITTGMGHPV
jgi:hypothetical protein